MRENLRAGLAATGGFVALLASIAVFRVFSFSLDHGARRALLWVGSQSDCVVRLKFWTDPAWLSPATYCAALPGDGKLHPILLDLPLLSPRKLEVTMALDRAVTLWLGGVITLPGEKGSFPLGRWEVSQGVTTQWDGSAGKFTVGKAQGPAQVSVSWEIQGTIPPKPVPWVSIGWFLLGVALLLGSVFLWAQLGWPSSTSRKVGLAGASFGLLLAVAGARVWMVEDYGSSLPFWDEWDELEEFFRPWFQGDGLACLFFPHCEHRLLTTRALALGVTYANGGVWDPRIQMFVNAFLAAGPPVILFLGLVQQLAGMPAKLLLALGIGSITIPPFFGWEDTLMAWQSQVFFTEIFSLLAIWLCIEHPPFSQGWVLGVLMGVLAFFSMASGALWAPVVAGVQLLAPPERETKGGAARRLWGSLLLAVVFLLFWMATPRVPSHRGLEASSLARLLHFWGEELAFPYKNSPWLAVLLWAPFGIEASRFLLATFQKKRVRPSSCLAVGWGLWVLGGTLAIAWGRGSGQIAPRYLELPALGACLNLALAISLVFPAARRPRELWEKGAIALANLASFLVLAGVLLRTLLGPPVGFKERIAWRELAQANLSQALEHGDFRALQLREGLAIGAPRAERVRRCLTDPRIQAFLVTPWGSGIPRGALAKLGKLQGAGRWGEGMLLLGLAGIGSWGLASLREDRKIKSFPPALTASQ
ncbi:hypothetical protein [Candidatus Methylacidithermus pantelleriae]|uniref:Uncharacterized protein n=1 Tax=Candidatus Methylacidithermus pantelleriae TaxID=2744239 RepID=A0A8J2BIE5_9BACT|nr:hypothetical protein [Candidatus Methylacidithermus pantelleriae]CAF0689051.1 membrane hypothetical protein [Candidatus Methylacidithermus pantelleriae]